MSVDVKRLDRPHPLCRACLNTMEQMVAPRSVLFFHLPAMEEISRSCELCGAFAEYAMNGYVAP